MSSQPNFLLIITDQQRADHLGCYGNRVVRTPHIDTLATQGARFTTSQNIVLKVVTAIHSRHEVPHLAARFDRGSGRDAPQFSLPPLEGLNLVLGLSDGAESLLVHPFLNAGDRGAPVVATREVGKGRSLAVLTDSTWLWSLPHVGGGGRGDAHRRFFANALRWLIRDPELSRVKVNVGKTSVGPEEEVPLEVRSFDASYRPEGGAKLEVKLLSLAACAR